MVRRLARRTRRQAPQSLHLETQSRAPPATADEGHRSKKSPRLGTLGQFAEAWSKAHGQNPQQSHMARQVAREWPQTPPHLVTENQIVALVHAWKAKHAQSTSHKYAASFKRLLAAQDRAAGTNLASAVPKLRRGQRRNTVCTDEIFEKLLKVSKPWFRIFLRLCRELGLRNSEARALKPNDYNEDTKTISFNRKMEGTSQLPVPPDLADTILYARRQNPKAPIVETLGAPENLNESAIVYLWAKTKRAAYAPEELRIHDLRRTAAKRLYDATRDIRLVQQLLGHNHISSTLAYIGDADPKELRRGIEQIAPTRAILEMEPLTQVPQ